MMKEKLIAITPAEMFDMIEDFADSLMGYVNPTMEERIHVCQLAEQIMNLLRKENIEGRLGIILMLQNAVAMYRIAQQEQSSCRLLN